MKNYRKFVDELRTKLEEVNALRAGEDVILDDVIRDAVEEPTARIIVGRDEDEDGKMENCVSVKLSKVAALEDDEDWIPFLEALKESIRYARSLESGLYKINRDNKHWATAKDRLIVRPIRYNNEFIESCKKTQFVYRQVGDVALTVYIIIKDEDGILSTAKLIKGLAEKWIEEGTVTEDEIYSQAFRNTQERYRPCLYTNIFDIENTPFYDCELMSNGYTVKRLSDNTVTLLTTSRKTNGAIAMWFDGVKEKISDLYGGSSFYAAFTSVHEAMIHKVGTISVESIRRNVTETNRIFGPDDTLSDLVWFYNAENKTFTAIEE